MIAKDGLMRRLARRFVGWLAGLALTVSAALVFATAAAAEPAVWKAQTSGGGTVYLFGTVHLIKPGLDWDTPKVERAFADSSELWLEVVDADDKDAAQALVLKYGLDLDHTLSAKLSDADRATLAKDVEASGLPMAFVDKMRPWLASISLTLAPLQKAGYDPKMGVDLTLKAKAVAKGEPVMAFETMEQQIRFFADLPPDMELDMLRQTLKDFDLDLKELNEAAGDWIGGDPEAIDRLMTEDMRKDAPALYEILLKRRNEAMADKIAERLKSGGTIFVAVGAAHLAGRDSIQTALERRGIHVTRL